MSTLYTGGQYRHYVVGSVSINIDIAEEDQTTLEYQCGECTRGSNSRQNWAIYVNIALDDLCLDALVDHSDIER